MSDLRFARELGAEFERLERAGNAGPRRRRFPSRTAKLTGRIASAVAVAVPLAIAVLAVGLLSHSRNAGRRPAGRAAGGGLALSGGNCRTPARIGPHFPGGPPVSHAPDGMLPAAGGRLSGIPWQLRAKPGVALPSAIEHGRLRLGGHEYGLCSQGPVPVPFGLINAGPHGVLYGYVTGAGSYRITVSAGTTPLTTSTTDTFFFIGVLPRPACSYRSLSVTATSTPVSGLPPNISRSLDDDAPRFTTTMRFGDCHPHALVTTISERGRTQGRSPNAPLARVTAQLSLTRVPGSQSHAGGTVWELTHSGYRGINVLVVGLRPGRYGIWLLGPRNRATAVAAVTVKHQLQASYDLPPDASSARQIVVTAQASGQIDTPGRIILRATLP